MKLHTKIELLKFCSSLLNFIFLVLGLSVAGCGVWILWDTSFISNISSDVLRVVALALLSVGSLVLLVAALGLVGAQRESRLLLLPAAVLLVLLLLAQAFITLLLLLSWNKISDTVTQSVDKLIQQYPEPQPRLLDNLQHYAKCCGRTGPSDWLENWFVQSLNVTNATKGDVLPCSCFSSIRVESGAFCSRNLTLSSDLILPGNSSYDMGCAAVLKNWLNENLFTIVGMDLSLIVIQILLLVSGVSLFKSLGIKSSVKSSEPDLDQDQVHNDQDLLHQDQDQGIYDVPYNGPYDQPYDGPYEGAYDRPYNGAYDGPYNGAYNGAYDGAYDGPYQGQLRR